MTGNRRLAKRYAKALGELAQSSGVIDDVQGDLEPHRRGHPLGRRRRFAVRTNKCPVAVKEELLLKLAGDRRG